MAQPGVIESSSQFKPTPSGLQEKWAIELDAAKRAQKPWWDQAVRAVKRYSGESEKGESESKKSRVNLFHANVNTVLAILFGQVPKVDVSRRFGDAADDQARVAAEALERILNLDIEDDADDFAGEVKDAIQDWKITGLGLIRLRYDMETEEVPGVDPKMAPDGRELAPAVPAYDKKTKESITTEYVFWKDVLWSPCRRWKDCRWLAFRAEMTRDELVKRFGEKLGRQVPLQSKKLSEKDSSEGRNEAWARAEVWEIWCKQDRTVYWYVDGMARILDSRKDTLELKNFFPCPKPLIGNATTTKLLPKPDLEIDRAIYEEIDDLAFRLSNLIKRTKVSGAYDKAFPDLARVLNEAGEGQLVAVAGWQGFMEKGGLAGAMQFVPLDPIVNAIGVLSQKLAEKIQLLYQVTGISDVVRGQAQAKATATEQSIKAQFASTRLQTDQDEVARFATDLQKLRAEIIAKHYDAETIIKRSNMMVVETIPNPQTGEKVPNLALIGPAVELIKSDTSQYRVEVKADSISLRDYAALKNERVETITTLAGLFQQSIPMVQMMPQAAPFVLELGKWLVASTKGSQQMEGVFDRFAAQAEAQANAPKPPAPPDPKLQATQVKAQAEMGRAQLGLVQAKVETQASLQKSALDLQKAHADHANNMISAEQQQRIEALKAVNHVVNPRNPIPE